MWKLIKVVNETSLVFGNYLFNTILKIYTEFKGLNQTIRLYALDQIMTKKLKI